MGELVMTKNEGRLDFLDESIRIDHRDHALKMLQRIRDEAHRFGITFHRQKRSKGFIHSELEQIEGVGERTISVLLNHFRTVEKVRTVPTGSSATICALPHIWGWRTR